MDSETWTYSSPSNDFLLCSSSWSSSQSSSSSCSPLLFSPHTLVTQQNFCKAQLSHYEMTTLVFILVFLNVLCLSLLCFCQCLTARSPCVSLIYPYPCLSAVFAQRQFFRAKFLYHKGHKPEGTELHRPTLMVEREDGLRGSQRSLEVSCNVCTHKCKI